MKTPLILLISLLAAGCTRSDEGVMSEFDQAAAGEGAKADQAPDAAPPEQAAQKPENVPITKREARLVDKQKALAENPDLIEVENKINASDPLTAVAQSYFTLGSRAHVAAMQHNLRIQKEIDGRWPTFEEFQQSLKQNNVKLSGLYAYQMYAYDQTTGGLTILEDRAEKKRIYEEAGRDYPHDD